MSRKPVKRLAPSLRKSEILQATLSLLAREGLQGYSLEAVAREAKVAASLPRHYFGGSHELLRAATEDVLREVETVLRSLGAGESVAHRLANYLDILRRSPWGHEVWMRAEELHPDLGKLVREARQRMTEILHGRTWSALSAREQIEGRGRVGQIESIVSVWIERGMREQGVVVDALVEAVSRAEVNPVPVSLPVRPQGVAG